MVIPDPTMQIPEQTAPPEGPLAPVRFIDIHARELATVADTLDDMLDMRLTGLIIREAFQQPHSPQQCTDSAPRHRRSAPGTFAALETENQRPRTPAMRASALGCR